VTKGLKVVAGQNLKLEGNPVIWTLSQYAQEGFRSPGVFIGYKAIKSHLRNLTRGDPTATNRVISVISKLVASYTEICIVIDFFQAKVGKHSPELQCRPTGGISSITWCKIVFAKVARHHVRTTS
jgi:hypothetical protein